MELFTCSLARRNHSVIFMQHWNKLDHHEGEPCPVARYGHAAVCLDYGGDHPQLLVIGGMGAGNKVLNDAWMLDVQSGRWKVYACRLDGVVCSAIPLDEMHWCHNVHGCMLFECEGMKGWMSTMLVYCAGQCSKPPVKIPPQCCCLRSQSRID